MDFDADSQPLFDDGLAPLKTMSDHEQSDSEDDFGLSSLADNDRYDNLNISDKMKSLLRLETQYDHDFNSGVGDDSESDDDSIFRAPKLVDIEKLNQELAAKTSKFTNFPLLPPMHGKTQEEDRARKVMSAKKPREKKKKRRDKGKQKQNDILEQAVLAKTSNKKLAQLFANFANEDNSDEEQVVKKKKKKKSGRKTRKEITPNDLKVDENGERLVRTTEFLDTDTSDSDDDEERAMSKKQELEMHRETERLRRSANASLKPVYNVKSFDDFVKRRDEREVELLNHLEIAQQQGIQQKLQEQKEREKQQKIQELLKKRKKLVIADEDEDLVIINDPSKTAEALISPERARNPLSSWSPVRHATSALRNHNKSMLDRITNEGYAHRIKMEEAAKSRGQYTSATERAKKLLEKEKNAILIDAQVKLHFEKNKLNIDDKEEDDDEEDDDYQEGAHDDFLNQLSGQEEEEEEEEKEEEEKEFLVEDFDIDMPAKRKISNDEESEDEQDMGKMAMKRWKGKKIRKSIFDDSDDDNDEAENKKVAQKPAPAHSISNFFKAKGTVVEEKDQDKPLVRLRRVIQKDEEEEEHNYSDNDDDAMDIDVPMIKHVPHISKAPPGPKEKNEYFEEEAEEEDDEFFGAGGEDIDDGENLDEFEEDDLLVYENNEHIDEGALREAFNKQDAESDNNMIQRLIKDVTGGGLRKQKAAAEAGLMLDDIDLYDEEDNDLIAIRRAAEAKRRKLLKKKGGDPLDNLLSDPKTAAFAKAAQAIPKETVYAFLSDSEVEEEDVEPSESIARNKLIIKEEEEEEDDDDDFMDVSDQEDNLVIANEFNPMAASPSRGDRLVITSADDDDEDFQVETIQNAKSPLNRRKSKSMFGSPARMERFKRLIAETNSSCADAPRVGFGLMTRTKSNNNEAQEGEGGGGQEKKTLGNSSIGGFLSGSQSNDTSSRKSKLSVLSKKSLNAFKYVG